MDFYFFHLMPWPHLPADCNGPAWVTCSIRTATTSRHAAITSTTATSTSCCTREALGFDGVVVNEHHANAYGNMLAPNLIASILGPADAALQDRGRGQPLPLYNPPVRLAEEFAMIDVCRQGYAADSTRVAMKASLHG